MGQTASRGGIGEDNIKRGGMGQTTSRGEV